MSTKTKKNNIGVSQVVPFVLLLAVVFLLVGGYQVYTIQQQKIEDLTEQVAALSMQINQQRNNTYISQHGVAVKVYIPVSNEHVSSPLQIIGQVPGSWSFEASFAVILKKSTGEVLAHGNAQLHDDWMTSHLVPFTAKLEYTQTAVAGEMGQLILQKDNPSGLPAKDDSVTIPVQL
jgi:hypothetical protein